MANLKIKIKLGQFEVELEGGSADVKETLKDLKAEGFGNMLGNPVITEQAIIIPEREAPKQLGGDKEGRIGTVDFPSMREIVIKQLPKTEVEWVVLYAFYAVHEKESFTKQDIREFYDKSNRASKSNISNLTHNFNAGFKKGYFTALNDDENLLTEGGKKLALDVLGRTEGAVRNTKSLGKSPKTDTPKSKTPSTTPTTDLKVMGELNLKPNGVVGLKEFLEDYNYNSGTVKNLLFTHYLSEILKIESITYNHIYSCYRWLDLKFPNAFVQSLRDTKAKKGWLLSTTDGEIKVSPKGVNAILDLKK